MVKTGIIIQARMGSSRLPGKVMKQINGKELLWYSYKRASESCLNDVVIIATTNNERDDIIKQWCDKNDIMTFRGSEEDVLDRYYQTALFYNLDVVVRLTSDNPFCDPEIIDMLLKEQKETDADYVSNRIETRTWPYGLDVEVFKFDTLKKAWSNSTKPEEREHVTPYILNHPELFKLIEIKNDVDLSDYRVTVDYREDFEKAKQLIEKFYADKKNWREIVEIMKENNWV